MNGTRSFLQWLLKLSHLSSSLDNRAVIQFSTILTVDLQFSAQVEVVEVSEKIAHLLQ